MKLVILGIDGLEYGFVERYNLSNIMQEDYGKTDLSDFDIIVTPPIWASFLTGRIYKDIMYPFKESIRRNKSPWWRAFKAIYNKIPLVSRKFALKLLTNPMRSTLDYLKRKDVETILEEFNSWFLTIPSYNDVHDPYASHLLREGIKELTKKGRFENKSIEFESYIFKNFSIRKERLLASLNDNYKLWFFYTDLLDALSHLFISDRIRMMKYYSEIDQLIAEVYKRVSNSSVIFVVSDHGMRRVGRIGDHSDHGFWSVNKRLGNISRNPKPTEFYNLWRDICNDRLKF